MLLSPGMGEPMPKVAAILLEMPTVKRAVIIPYTRGTKGRTLPVNAIGWDEFLEPYRPADIGNAKLPAGVSTIACCDSVHRKL